jgi:lipopolysaccharide cholinephosphotransferase
MEQYTMTENELKKLHDIELELLEEVDRICRKNHISYSIDGGTLLGAVRHGGFIPWDDDADVIMNRSEYNRFVQALSEDMDKNKFYFQDINCTRGYRWGYGKLRRKDTQFVRLGQEYMPYEQGVFLDIFVCDNVPDNYLLRCLCNFHSFLFRKVFYSEVGKNNAKGFSRIVYRILNKIPEESIKRRYSSYIKFRNRKRTNWVKCLTFPACNNTYGYKREWYEDTIDMKFEGKTFRACRKYEEYLTFLYGDYMEIPPVEQRKVHPVSTLKLL